MMEKNRGHLVSIASLAGRSGIHFLTDYCASKFAAVGFCEALTSELRYLGVTGVKITSIQPFFINTGLTWNPIVRYVVCLPAHHKVGKSSPIQALLLVAAFPWFSSH